AEGRIEEAYRSIKRDNPFPAICGRICNARCEDACSRSMVDQPIGIRSLKRYVTDAMMHKDRVAPQPAERLHDEKIAIIGAGPCGLTAAQDLALAGYAVTVFESLPVAGGMLRVGVPEYRLPADIIEREVADIIDLGVELRLSTPVDNIDDLLADGFDAVLVAVGAHEGNRLPIPGNDLNGILINTVLLRDVRLHQLDDSMRDPRPDVEGKRVVVIGGGDVAMDVARTALRLGAVGVQVAMRESEDDIPASPAEAAGAREENIPLHTSLNFLGVRDDGNGNVAGLECQRVNKFDIDADGRWIPDLIEGSEFVIDADVVIFSAGQKVGLSLIPQASGVKVNANHTLEIDPGSFSTGQPG
ncbi:MAG: FAD-dependent oxidoreductase, partial [Gammaproteobacteria bacterium]|nr:FAD-dependent oxidoreductase [Gammaproteobacteria bacterium]